MDKDYLQRVRIRVSGPEAADPDGPVRMEGTVRLTGSKSESNRALMLQALSGGRISIHNLSEADDTRLMTQALEQVRSVLKGIQKGKRPGAADPVRIDIGPAGTVMRFMTAFLPTTAGEYLLTGSERMLQRPIGLLVEALREIGADVRYQGQAGYPPLMIRGPLDQLTDRVRIPGNVSSQYLSALLMIAPVLPMGLSLQIEGPLTSRPYLTMTLDMLGEAGIGHSWTGDLIRIPPQDFRPATLYVEPDWSAASYWYSLLALAGSGTVFLPGLKDKSLQGDRAIARIMEAFGIRSMFQEGGVLLEKFQVEQRDTANHREKALDFASCPDLAQTIIACAAALRKDLSFTGLHTLRIKETDRIAALQNEIGKFGVRLIEKNPENSSDPAAIVYQLDTSGFHRPAGELVFDTYEDHRMAMAFAPLALVFGNVTINHPKVVEKSYPDFWKHLAEIGLILV